MKTKRVKYTLKNNDDNDDINSEDDSLYEEDEQLEESKDILGKIHKNKSEPNEDIKGDQPISHNNSKDVI
jgi:hypothetical protein